MEEHETLPPYTREDAVKLLRWLDNKLERGATLTKGCGDHAAIKRALDRYTRTREDEKGAPDGPQ
jgi:hypothetical protein